MFAFFAMSREGHSTARTDIAGRGLSGFDLGCLGPSLHRAAALALALLAFGRARGETRVFQRGAAPGAVRDVTITVTNANEPYNDPDTVYANNNLRVDGWPNDNASLIRFDLSSIPVGTAITSAQLELNAVDATTESVPFFVRELLVPWTEGEATFHLRSAGVPWEVSGALGATDRSPVAVAQGITSAVGPFTLTFNAAGVALVQKWVDQPGANFGVQLENYGYEDASTYNGCEAPTVASRPALRVVAGGVSLLFRDGESPSAAYAGCEDTVIAHGPPTGGNLDESGLRLAGSTQFNSAGLLWFDLSSLPQGTVVQSASLGLMLERRNGQIQFEAHVLARPWTELGASWTTTDGGTPWEQPGAAGLLDSDSALVSVRAPTALGPFELPLGDAGVAAVQAWVSGARPNDGFALRNGLTGMMTFKDSEWPVLAQRPTLTLEVLIPDAGTEPPDAGTEPPDAGEPLAPLTLTVACNQMPGAGLLAGLATGALLLRRRRR